MLFAVEVDPASGGAIITLVVTNILAVLAAFKKEKRTDAELEAGGNEKVIRQWEQISKTMERQRDAERQKREKAEERERVLIASLARLEEQVRGRDAEIAHLRSLHEGSGEG